MDYYGINRDKEEKSILQKESLSSQSAWMAKRQRSRIEKDLDILKNRISLLSQAEQKTKKKIKEMKDRTEKILEIKSSIELENIKVYFFFFWVHVKSL